MVSAIICMVILLASTLGVNATIVGYDCINKATNISVISLSEITKCEPKNESLTEEEVNLQVVQLKSNIKVPIRSCLVKISTLITHCGMHSHSSQAYKGFKVDVIHEITESVCDRLIEYGEFRSLGGIHMTGIKVNTTVVREVTDFGEITDTRSSNCEGVDVYIDDVYYKSVIVSRSYKFITRVHEGIMDNDDAKVKLSSGYSYEYSDGSGFDPDYGYSYWNKNSIGLSSCEASRLIMIYSGLGKILTTSLGDKTAVINTQDQVMAIALKTRTILCSHHAYMTDHSKLYIILGQGSIANSVHSAIDSSNLDMFLYTNSKFVYIEKHFKGQINNLYNNLQNQICSQNYQLLNQLLSMAYISPEEFAWAYSKSPGVTAILRGEALYLIKCTPVFVEPEQTSRCYQEIPVLHNNETKFLKPRNRILVSKGTEIDCNPLAPALFKFNEAWYTITYPPTKVVAPMQLSAANKEEWHYQDVDNVIRAGLYKLSDLEKYRKKLMFPLEKVAIENIITSKSSGSDFEKQDVDILNLFDKVSVQSLKKSIFEEIYGVTYTVSMHVASFSGFIIILMALKSFVNMILNGTLLYKSFGFSVKILTAFWGTLAKHILYFKVVDNMTKNNTSDPDIESAPMMNIGNNLQQPTNSGGIYPSLKETTENNKLESLKPSHLK